MVAVVGDTVGEPADTVASGAAAEAVAGTDPVPPSVDEEAVLPVELVAGMCTVDPFPPPLELVERVAATAALLLPLPLVVAEPGRGGNAAGSRSN